jgi:hypothetical protein
MEFRNLLFNETLNRVNAKFEDGTLLVSNTLARSAVDSTDRLIRQLVDVVANQQRSDI